MLDLNSFLQIEDIVQRPEMMFGFKRLTNRHIEINDAKMNEQQTCFKEEQTQVNCTQKSSFIIK